MVALIVKDSKKKARTLTVNGFVKPSGIIVASVTNEKNKTYFVQIRPNGVTCTCESRKVCYHIKAVQSAQLSEYAQITSFNIFEIIALANEQINAPREVVTVENFYEVEGPRKNVTFPSAKGSCGHLVKPQHAGTPCGACLCK